MPLNRPYASVGDLPVVAPVFPLPGVMLLPRGELPLNIFEPRYLAMIDDAVKGDRLIGMIQPATDGNRLAARPELESVGALGRITQLAETGDGRYILNLTGVIRFRVAEELATTTLYRQCRLDVGSFAADLEPADEDSVDRPELILAFHRFARAKSLQVDWSAVEQAPTEALVTSLSMMSPFGPGERQALLEAKTLADRAKLLIAFADPDSDAETKPATLH